ncbi:MAG: PucR family transcriptional regulator [Mycobacteriales bacterium]
MPGPTVLPTVGVPQLLRELAPDLDTLTSRLVCLIREQDTAYEVDHPVSPEDLWESCRANLAQVLGVLLGEAADESDPFEAPRETGRRRADQGMPLESVLHAYRLGGRVIWEGLVEQVRNSAPAVDRLDPATLLEAATAVWRVVDRFSVEVASAYRARETALSARDSRRQQALFDALLDGLGSDDTVARQAATTLNLPLEGGFLVVVAAYAPDRPEPLASPRETLAGRGIRSAWRVRADREVGIVASGGRAPAGVVALLRELVHGQAGISPPVSRLADVETGYRLAETALRTLPAGRSGAAWLDECLVEAVLVATPDLARRLARRTLGGLLDLPGAQRERLLTTLEAYLDTGCSAHRAAGRLYCHRNTVLNRLHHLEEVAQCQVDRDRVALTLSLAAVRLLGD